MRIAHLLLLLPPLLPVATAQSNPQLTNGGFESSEVASGWNRSPADAPAGLSVQIDAVNHREGRQSVLITADRPSSFSLYQKVFLPVGTLWRASASSRAEYTATRPEPCFLAT